jgi:hypothetical protein
MIVVVKVQTIFICRICNEDVYYHAWDESYFKEIDHPFISNNLEYLEYLYDKKEKANVK